MSSGIPTTPHVCVWGGAPPYLGPKLTQVLAIVDHVCLLLVVAWDTWITYTRSSRPPAENHENLPGSAGGGVVHCEGIKRHFVLHKKREGREKLTPAGVISLRPERNRGQKSGREIRSTTKAHRVHREGLRTELAAGAGADAPDGRAEEEEGSGAAAEGPMGRGGGGQ